MDCREFEDLIGAFIDGELTGKALSAFESHRQACTICTMLVETIMENHALFAAFPEAEPSPALTEKILAATSKAKPSSWAFLKSLFKPTPNNAPMRRRLVVATLTCLFIFTLGFNLFNTPSGKSLDPTGGASPILDSLSNRIVHRFAKIYEGVSETWTSVVDFSEKTLAFIETKWEQMKSVFSPSQKKKTPPPNEDKKEMNKSGKERMMPWEVAALTSVENAWSGLNLWTGDLTPCSAFSLKNS